MTKQNFIALADAIRRRNYLPNGIPNNHEDRVTLDNIEFLADFCQSQNPAFKRDRWIGYLYGQNGPNGGSVAAVEE
jgi:hypothetical protein